MFFIQATRGGGARGGFNSLYEKYFFGGKNEVFLCLTDSALFSESQLPPDRRE